MSRKIVIPKDLRERYKKLTFLQNETDGILIYKQNGDTCLVSTLLMTGSGSSGHVISDPQRVRVINRLFEDDPSLRFVKFHTHTSETGRTYGEEYLAQFSTGDTEGYKEQFRQDKEFIGMLITPQVELLCGMDNPELTYCNSNAEIIAERTRVEGLYQNIQSELGMEFSRLEGKIV